MSESYYQYSDAKKSINFRSLIIKYLRYWYVFMITVALTVGGAYLYLRQAIPAYQIKAVLLLKKDAPKTAGAELVQATGSATDEKNIENEIETFRSRSLMNRVVNALNLTVGYFKKGSVRENEEIYETSPIRVVTGVLTPLAYREIFSVHILDKKQYEIISADDKLIGKFSFGQVAKNEFGTFTIFLNDSLYQPDNNLVKVAFYDSDAVVDQYLSSLTVNLLNQKSTVLTLSLESPIPAKGKAILGKLMDEYAQAAFLEKNQEATGTLRFIDERLRLITGELSTVEKNIETYKSARGITDLSTEGNLIFETVKNNDAKLNEVDIQLQALTGVEKYLKSSLTGAAPAVLMVNDPVLTGLLTRLNELQSEQEKYIRTTQPDNPFRQTVDGQIASTKRAVNEYVSNQRQNLLVTQSSLTKRSSLLTSSIKTIPQKEREFLTIKRQQAIKESLFLLLLQKKEETAISYASTVKESRVMDYPYSSPYPIKPNRSSIYMLALFAGLLIPLGFIGIRSALNDKIRLRKEIEAETGVPVFGEIARKPGRSKDNIIDLGSHSLIAEQFKILRANLQHETGPNNGLGQVVLITSSVSGEGKSFISVNLSLSLALLDKRVIVLELDLRKPQIANYLGMAHQPATGISDYLLGKAGYDQLVQQSTAHPNLYFIPSGPIPANPTELLSNGTIEVLLNQLRETFDYIILDTPPVSMLADATLLSPYVDAAFYVVRHEYTPRNYMRFLANLRNSERFRSLNVIVNAVNYPNAEDFGYGYAYPVSKSYRPRLLSMSDH